MSSEFGGVVTFRLRKKISGIWMNKSGSEALKLIQKQRRELRAYGLGRMQQKQ